jgi:glutaminase
MAALEQELKDAYTHSLEYTRYGEVASYIPELAHQDSSHLGAAVCTLDGERFAVGDCGERFTLQSISKLVTLILAIEQNGQEYVFTKVGYEPTGDSFNSLVRLDSLTKNKPYNPLINAGAIAVTSCIRGIDLKERKQTALAFAKKLFGSDDIRVNENVYASEMATTWKNRAIVNLMKSNGVIESNDLEDILDLYVSMCSIEVNCRELAEFAALLANNGRRVGSGEQLIPVKIIKLVRSLMVTCGMYDYSGEYASQVGIPSKSGVGGGILAAAIGKMGIAVYGPSLDRTGNSIGGLRILSYLSEHLDLNMF